MRWLYLFCEKQIFEEKMFENLFLQGYEMVSFDTVSVPPPVEDPDEKKEVHLSPHQILINMTTLNPH